MQQCCLCVFSSFSSSRFLVVQFWEQEEWWGDLGATVILPKGLISHLASLLLMQQRLVFVGFFYFCSSKFWDWGVGEGSGCNPNPPQGSSCNTGGTFLPSCYYKLTSIVLHLLCIILEMCLLYITTTSTSVCDEKGSLYPQKHLRSHLLSHTAHRNCIYSCNK